MIRNIIILTFNDLAIAFKNKTLYLILFIPLFVFVALALVDGTEPDGLEINIGLLEQGSYPPAMIEGLNSAGHVFTLTWLASEAEGEQWLNDRHGDGLLVPPGNPNEGSSLVVLTKASFQTLAIVDGVTELQRALEGKSSNWISDIRPLQDIGLQRQLLPTWILMLVLLVGFIILPAQVAEEKEKKLLLGLLQTPIREVEWLFAKIIYGVILVALAALFLQLLTRLEFGLSDGLGYLTFVLAGGFCFSSFGILVGFLCRTQASARTLGVIIYLPHLLPSALSDFSKSLNVAALLLPSYQFYQPIKSILMKGGSVSGYQWELLYLVGVGLLAALLSHRLMKNRWLM
jgi:ABC-2 type transport system permease protein